MSPTSREGEALRGDLHDWMRVGIVHFMAFPETMKGDGPVLQTVRRIATDDDFESIEITQVNDPAERKAVRELLATAHMEVGFGAQPVQLGNKLDINAADPEVRAASVERLKAAIRDAAELGASKFALMSGPDPGPEQ